MPAQKTFYILRHAKTETARAGQDDHERRLTRGGLEEAQAMGAYIHAHGIAPDQILCSTAVRARQTWEALNFPLARTAFNAKLYLASPNQILAILARMPEDNASLMVIGHNPGLHQLCLQLAKTGDDALLQALAQGLPTGALAHIALNTPWHDIALAQGELVSFVTPPR